MAIKKIPGVFDDLMDAKRIVREIRLLRHFNHENVMKLVDIRPPSSLEDFDVRQGQRHRESSTIVKGEDCPDYVARSHLSTIGP